VIPATRRDGPLGDRPAVTAAVVGITLAVCAVNGVIAVHGTLGIDGRAPAALERRYGALRAPLGDVSGVVYLSDERWRFVEARYALAPVILDPGYVVIDAERRAIASLAIDALVADAAAEPPVVVLCDFTARAVLEHTVDELAEGAEDHGLAADVLSRGPGVALITLRE
jgi:hypothetical protein